MKEKYIKINDLKNLSDFVKEASKVKGDVLVHRGKFCVDGRSLMGMLSIDISEGGTIQYPKDATNFEEYIKQFEILS